MLPQIRLAADVVDHAIFQRIKKQAVHREISAFGVFFGGGEVNFAGMSPIEITAIAAKGRHFDDTAPLPDQYHSKRRPHGLRTREQFSHARRRRIRGHVKILGRDPQQHVADASACEVGHVTRLPQTAKHHQRVFARTRGFATDVGRSVHIHMFAARDFADKRPRWACRVDRRWTIEVVRAESALCLLEDMLTFVFVRTCEQFFDI